MDKRGKMMLVGSGITAAVMALAESARYRAADYLVRLALDRDIPPHPPGAERRLSGSTIDDAMLKRVEDAGKDLAAHPHEIIQIQGRDSTHLAGHWMEVPAPKRVVIAMHGWRSAWDHDFGMVSDFFRDNDCNVLYAEQRGQGGSGGAHMGFGLTERYDCLDWVDWVNQKTGGTLPIYLCGISMGASTVLMAGGLDLPQNVRGILADCGFTSAVDIWKHVAKQAHLAYPIYGGTAGKLAKKRLCVAMDADSCPQSLARCRVPVLFVHGTDDHFVPIEMTYENYKACASPKRLFVVPGAEHGMSYLTDPQGYENAVKSFWTDFDNRNLT